MKVITLRGDINTVILFAVLILNTLFQSEIGGPGTIFNTISFLLVLVFLVLNPRFNSWLSLLFAVPVLFLMLSVLFNITTLHAGGFRSALATTAGYMLLMLRPLPLNVIFLRRLIFLYLLACLAISIIFTLDNLSIAVIVGNPNFNVNPNAASAFFLGCLILSLIFLQLKTKWVFSIAYSLMILTTASRAGIGSSVLVWVLYLWLAVENQSKRAVFRTRFMAVASFVTMSVLAVYLVPDSVDFFSQKLAATGLVGLEGSRGGGRDEIWSAALEVADASPMTILFGTGPATTAELVGRGSHSSYVAAMSSNGYPFIIFTLVAILALFRFHIKLSQRQFLAFAIPILLYGIVQEMLFSGIGSLWYIFIFLSLYFRSLGVAHPTVIYRSKLADRTAGRLAT